MSCNRLPWIIFWLCAAIGFSLFFVPAFIIRPFRHQTASGLSMAMALRQRAPMGTLFAAIICLLIVLLLWNGLNRWRKILVGAAMFLVVTAAVMARLNYFEWMFHPVESPRFDAEASSKLDKDEMVLAIQFGPDARAYPISEMAYHHIVNDWVNGVPVAVTY